LRILRTAYLIGMGLLAVVYHAVAPIRPVAPVLMGALTILAIGWGTAVWRPRRRQGWVLLATATMMIMAQESVFAVLGHLGPPVKTFPAPNEILYLITTPLLAVALVLLGRPAVRTRDVGMILDVAVIGLTNGLIVWTTLLRPAIEQEGLSTTSRVITFANILLTVGVLGAGFRVILSWYRVAALRWIGVGVLGFIGGAGMYAGALQRGLVEATGPSEYGFQIFVACCGAAALSPSMAQASSDPQTPRRVAPAGIVALTLSVLIAPAALVFEARSGPVSSTTAFAAVFAGLCAVAVIRLALSVNDRRSEERERHYRSLVVTSHDVVLISREGRIEYATPSADLMFSGDVRGRRFDEVIVSRARTDGQGEYEGQVHRPGEATLIVHVRERDLSDDPHVSGVVATIRDVTAERVQQMDLAYQASHDPLTGLANRHSFHTAMRTCAETPRAVIFVDLDDFKTINDTYGHQLGDRALEVVARRIEGCLRAGDLAARLGGDEFAVLLSDVPDVYAARAMAQRITDALAATAVIEGVTVRCPASVGLAYGSMAQLHEADLALYSAKAAGKGRWCQYGLGMPTPAGSLADTPDERLPDFP
jgi:diguanylate cyclase (GGDEF)-like protein